MDEDYRKYGTSRAAHLVIQDPHKCFVCNAPVPDDAINCPACGFPQNGDEASQRYFLGQLRGEKHDLKVVAFGVNRAFHFLLLLPFYIFAVSYGLWVDKYIFTAEIIALFGIAFLAIWFFGRSKPFLAFAISMALYAILSTPLIIFDPSIIIKTRFFILGPYIFLGLGMSYFKNWRTLNEDLKGKNTG